MTLAATRDRIGRLDFPTSRVALELPPGLSFEEWKEIGIPLLEAGQSLMWWVGDWLNYGELEYRESYAAAAEWTGMEYQTLANAKWVCERVEVSRRRETLSFGHHAAVAALDRRSQAQLLTLAQKEGFTVQALRTEVRRRNDERRTSAKVAFDAAAEELRRADEAERAAAASSPPARRRGRAEARLVVSVPVGDQAAMVEALDRAAAGLRSWFAGEGIDARIEVASS